MQNVRPGLVKRVMQCEPELATQPSEDCGGPDQK